MSFVDVVVGSALILIVFLALFGLLRASVLVSALTKSKAIATTVAESQMEYIRGLSYDAVGTVGGIPAGTVPQYGTTTSNGITYTMRTFIDYADDPADGTGGSDTNGIITDYKRIKVSVTYYAGGRPRTIDIVSNYTPAGLETTTGGGTLKIVVVNASGVAVPGATVRIANTSTSPTVDVTTFSDSTGIVYLPGAATSSQYQIYVSKDGYSSAQTYLRDTTNQNPTPGYLTVAKDLTTTSTFAIDLLANLTMRTYTPIATTTFADSFSNSGTLAQMTNTAVSGGSLMLANAGGYAPSGTARSSAIAPTYLASWSTASSTRTTPGGTTAVIHIVDGSGALIPDAVLAGNSAGFTSTVNLYGISTTTYPSLALSADLTTSATTTTPTIADWGLSYQRGPIPLPNVAFTLTGAKTKGSTGTGTAIYKTTTATSTDSAGINALMTEWDSYALSLTGYDAVDACGVAPPYVLAPGTYSESNLYLTTATTNSVLVSVRDSAGVAVPGATVTVSKSGYTGTVTTSSCGGAYFGGLTSAATYTITVSKAGYTTDTNTNISISGHLFYVDTL